MKNEILAGTKVMVFDPRLFEDDESTPLSHTIRPATVVCRYGNDLVDVIFDYCPNEISYGHFTNDIEKI